MDSPGKVINQKSFLISLASIITIEEKRKSINEPYLLALRILQAQAKGKTSREISEITQKSQRAIQLFLSRYRNYQGQPSEQEFLEKAFKRGRPSTLSFSEKMTLQKEIRKNPDIKLGQIIRICQERFDKGVGKSTAKALREYAVQEDKNESF